MSTLHLGATMIAYPIKSEKNQKVYLVTSSAFPDLAGYGKTESDAMIDLVEKLHKELNTIIKKNQTFPKSIAIAEISRLKRKKTELLVLNNTASLSMYLHSLMLSKGITRMTLAERLSGSKTQQKQVSEPTKITGRKPPNYKQVQRLLDVTHHSTIRELSEAFRVLDARMDFVILEDKIDKANPIIEI